MNKILYVPTLNLGVIYWRVENYAQALLNKSKKCSVHVEYFDLNENNVSWDKSIGESEELQEKLNSAFKSFDTIIFQKIQNIEGLDFLKKCMRRHPSVDVILEIDDSIGEVSGSNPHNFTNQHSIAAEHACISHAIIASTKYLANSIKKIVGDDKPIHISPNCINHKIWKSKGILNDTGEIRIGYVGGYSHDEDLLVSYKAMIEIFKKRKDIKFVIRYGGYKPEYMEDHDQIDFKQVAWHPSIYDKKLEEMKIDIGLAPLRDTEFNRCKSNIKCLEWAALGIPTICSDVEPYKENILKSYKVSNIKSKWEEEILLQCDRLEIIRKEKKDIRLNSRKYFNIDKECDKLLEFLDKY